MGDTVIEVRNLVKVYPDGTKALDKVSLEIRKGELFSLLGRNGAGKTTFIRIVSTQLMPTQGDIKVFGYDVKNEPKRVRQRIAVLPQESNPAPLLTPWEHVYYYALLRGFNKSDARREAEKTLKELGLWEYRSKPTSLLSGGLRRRVLLAMVMVTNADLLLLDEPTVGLDPIIRKEIWHIIRYALKEGKTVLLTTHYMEEAEALSDRLAIIDRGKLLAAGSIDEIKAFAGAGVCITVEGKISPNKLSPYGDVVKIGKNFMVYLKSEEDANELAKQLVGMGLQVGIRPINLEDAFVKLVGGGIENEGST